MMEELTLSYLNGQLENIKKIVTDIEKHKSLFSKRQSCGGEHDLKPEEKEQIMTYKGISMHKRKDCRVWYTRFRMNGKQHYISGKTQVECYENLKQAWQDKFVEKCEITIATKPKTKRKISNLILKDWCETWKTTYKKGNVRIGTYKAIEYLIKNHFHGYIFEMDLSQILPLDCEKYIKGLEKVRVKENAFIYLKDIFRKAVENGYIEKSPMEHMTKPKRTQKKEEKEILSKEEQERFEEVCLSDYKYSLLLFAVWQGVRIGELRALERNDFDFDKKIVRISKSESDNEDMETKNTYSDRIMPLFPKTEEMLKRFLKTTSAERPFYHTKNYISKILDEVIEKIGITKNITMHSLRHTFITRCQEKDIPLYILQSWIGHAQGSVVTTKVYTHKQEDAEMEAIQKLVS